MFGFKSVFERVCTCAIECVRENVCVCRERERERESVCRGMKECVCVFRERESR